MNHTTYGKSAPHDQLGESIKNLENLLGLQQSYLSREANTRNRISTVGWGRQMQSRAMQAYGSAGATPRGLASSSARSPRQTRDPKLELELARLRQEMEMQRKRDVWEREDRQRAIDARNAQQGHWAHLRSMPSGLTEATNLQGANLLSRVAASSPRKKSSSR